MKVIIAGDRHISSYELVETVVEEAIEKMGWDITEVVSGKARGVDTLGERYAKEHRIPIKPFPAEWNDLSHPDAIIRLNKFGQQYDAMAGIRRNAQMAYYADAAIVIYTNSSVGSKDMIKDMELFKKPLYKIKV